MREREVLEVNAPAVNGMRGRIGVSVPLREHHVRAWLSGVRALKLTPFS